MTAARKMTAPPRIDPAVDEYRNKLAREFMGLRTHYEDVCESLAPHYGPGEVRRRALAVVRPELRAFLSVVLTRAPLDAIERSTGLLHDWSATDSLLDSGSQEMQKLIATTLPEATWTKIDAISAKKAQKEDHWALWTSKWLHEFGSRAEVNPEKGRWARFFSGIETAEWIKLAVQVAADVDTLRRERAAANEARRPLTLDEIVTMKGGTILRPEDGVAALRGTYQHPDSPAPAPPPTAARKPAPSPPGQDPSRFEMIADVGRLAALRGQRLQPPAESERLDEFYRWGQQEWLAIKSYAAALEWDPSKTFVPVTTPANRTEMLRSLEPLARLRGRRFAFRAADCERFYQWAFHEWTTIKARAAALEWRPSTAGPSAHESHAKADAPPQPPAAPTPAQESQPKADAPPEAPPEAPAVPTPALERRVATLEDEFGRLRSSVVFLSLNLDMQIKRAEEERESLQRQISELRDLIMQAQSTSAPVSTSPIVAASAAPTDAPTDTPTDAAPNAAPVSTSPVEAPRTTDAAPIPASTAPVEAPDAADAAHIPVMTAPSEAADGSDEDHDDTDANDANDARADETADEPDEPDEPSEPSEPDMGIGETEDAMHALTALVDPAVEASAESEARPGEALADEVAAVERKAIHLKQVEDKNVVLRGELSHLQVAAEGLPRG